MEQTNAPNNRMNKRTTTEQNEQNRTNEQTE